SSNGGIRSGHALMAQQGVQRRIAATEGPERLYRRPAATGFKDGLSIFSSGFNARQPVFTHGLLECGVGVGTQDLGPLVAVVPGGVASSKNVTESMCGAAEIGRLDHRDFLAYLREQGHEVLRWVVIGVQLHVKECELDLA